LGPDIKDAPWADAAEACTAMVPSFSTTHR
jgi:hypothetical protein